MSAAIAATGACVLTCSEVTALVTDYLERRLPLRDRLRMWMHIKMCAGCDRYVAQVRAVLAVSRSVSLPSPPPDVVASLSARFTAMPPSPR